MPAVLYQLPVPEKEDSAVPPNNDTEIALLRQEVKALSEAVKSHRSTDTDAINALNITLNKYVPWIEEQMARDQWRKKLRYEVLSKVVSGSVWGLVLALGLWLWIGLRHWVQEELSR